MFGGGGAAGGAAGGARGGGGGGTRVTVLLVDEMDLLVTRKQSVCARAATLTLERAGVAPRRVVSACAWHASLQGGVPSGCSLVRAPAMLHFRARCRQDGSTGSRWGSE